MKICIVFMYCTLHLLVFLCFILHVSKYVFLHFIVLLNIGIIVYLALQI